MIAFNEGHTSVNYSHHGGTAAIVVPSRFDLGFCCVPSYLGQMPLCSEFHSLLMVACIFRGGACNMVVQQLLE